MRRLIALTFVAMMGIVIAACGLPSNDDFTRINEDEDGFGLSQVSTSTTTTTTIAPSTTLGATTSTSIEVTTTTPLVEPVIIYFPTGRSLTKVPVQLSIDPALNQVMASILKGPPEGDAFVGLRAILPSDLPSNATVTATDVGGVAYVDFPAGIFDDLSASDQRLVFAQIVLTLTGRPGIGQVLFTQEQQPISVFLGDFSTSAPGDLVTRNDYKDFLAGSGDPVETTTTTTTTTTTSPPDAPVDTTPLDG